MWSVSAGKTVRLFVGHNEGIYSVIFSPDGKYVASGGEFFFWNNFNKFFIDWK